MANNTFLKVEDVAEILGVSKSYAYKIVRSLNAELKEKGFLVVSGRINRRYFLEKAQIAIASCNSFQNSNKFR